MAIESGRIMLCNQSYWSFLHLLFEKNDVMPFADAPPRRDKDGKEVEDRPPPSDLVTACKEAWRRHNNPNFLVPIFGALSSQEVLSLLPQFIPLESAKLQQAFDRLMRKRPGIPFIVRIPAQLDPGALNCC